MRKPPADAAHADAHEPARVPEPDDGGGNAPQELADQNAQYPGCHFPFRRATRKRGAALETAIYDAVLDELARCGYDALTIEAVAAGARTGKASIYRRWASKEDLVVDTLQRVLPAYGFAPDTGSLRGDLIELLRRVAAALNEPSGCAIARLMSDLDKDRDLVLAVKHRLLEPRKQMALDLLRRGVHRGEVRPDALTMLTAETGPALLIYRFLTEGPPVTDDYVVQVVDEVLLPLLRPCR